MNHDKLIRRLAPITDEEAARMVSPQAKTELSEQITATAVPARHRARRRRGLVVGLPLAAAAATAAIAVAVTSAGSGATHATPTPSQRPGSGPVKVQLAALSFSTQGKYLVVKVNDPLADPARYRKEFAAHGMDIDLKLVPVSPSIVGTVVMSEGSMKMITARGRCHTGGGGAACPVGVKIPLGYKEHAQVVFGRAARPGEQYSSSAPVEAPGEVMHGMTYRGRTVAEVVAMLKKRHVTVPEYRYEGADGDNAPYRNGVPPEKVQPGWFVHDASPWAQNQVLLFVGPTRQTHAPAGNGKPPAPGFPFATPTAR
ncbi:hypothetical protein GCM10023196_084770 [Actinoallomurus vinaceus]|uniref:PASTA domain-containing protein n=1 Tax=Actinoallomurus vinaceus TaxID=1080074 RepID=A0ABP8UP50_9ACTN